MTYLDCDWRRIGHLEFNKIAVRLLSCINLNNGRAFHRHLIVCHFWIVLFKGYIKFEWLARVGFYSLILLNILANKLVFSTSVKAWVQDGVEINHYVFTAHIPHVDVHTKLFAILRNIGIKRNIWKI